MVSTSKKSKKIHKKVTKKSSGANETNELLKKLINIEKKQNKLTEKLIELLSNNNIEVTNHTGKIDLEIKSQTTTEPKLKIKENSLANVEREILLDIPSLNIKDEFKINEEIKEKVKKLEEHKKGFGLFRNKKKENENEKLKKITLKNLKKIIQTHDERKQIVGISYILRQFLEIKFRISQSLTYSKMISEIKSRKIEENLKNQLITFFSKLLEEIYKGEKIDISADYAFKLANQTIQELSKYNRIEKVDIKNKK